FHKPPRLPLWKTVNLAASIPGWTRFAAAEEWLKNWRGGQATGQSAEFKQFMSQRTNNPSPEQTEQLFREFLIWRNKQNKGRIRPPAFRPDERRSKTPAWPCRFARQDRRNHVAHRAATAFNIPAGDSRHGPVRQAQGPVPPGRSRAAGCIAPEQRKRDYARSFPAIPAGGAARLDPAARRVAPVLPGRR